MKKWLLVLGLVVVMGEFFIGKVEAITCSKQLGVENSDGSVSDTGEIRTVGVGDTICDKYHTIYTTDAMFSQTYYFVYYKLLVCGSDGNYDNVQDGCGACIDNYDGKADCASPQDFKCEDDDGNKYRNNQTRCVSYNSLVACDGTTGDWGVEVECLNGKFCKNGTCLSETCTENGVTANIDDVVCVNNNKSECLETADGDFEILEECSGQCVDNNELIDGKRTATCVGDENNLGACTELPNGTSVGSVGLNQYYCSNDETLYKCKTIPTLTWQDYCSDNTTDGKIYCGRGDDGTIGCISETEFEENDQSGTSGTTSITSSTYVYDPSGGKVEDGGCGEGYVMVASWCFPYDAGGIATKLIQIIFGIAGGTAFLLMVYGFIMVATSSGDEKKLQAAKETITSAIVGLLISLFALFLFRLIAVNILQIPGLS